MGAKEKQAPGFVKIRAIRVTPFLRVSLSLCFDLFIGNWLLAIGHSRSARYSPLNASIGFALAARRAGT
jgi:hypothetical protein